MKQDFIDFRMHTLAAGINYFYSSRDQGFSEKHVQEYYRLNCGTYYWSIENGRNDLLIERMRERLLGVPGKSLGPMRKQRKSSRLGKAVCCTSIDTLDMDGEEMNLDDMNMGDVGASSKSKSGKVTIRCGTRCTSVEPLPDGTVRLEYEPACKSTKTSKSSDKAESDSEKAESDSESRTQVKSWQDENSDGVETAIFDHVLICVAPHVAQKILKNCCPLQSLFDQCPFRPVRAHAIVHTDRSVKCTSNPTALTYEIGEDGSWILHIDCEEYYRMEKGQGNNNIVSIFYAPDTCDSIDPALVKGRFSTILSKSTVHDQGSEQDVEKVLGARVRAHHQDERSNVYLCGSYYGFEQWSQDAFAMAVEVADCVVEKFRNGTQLNVAARSQTIVSL
jgi:hypothetical protein